MLQIRLNLSASFSTLLLCACFLSAFGQRPATNELINSGELIQKGIELHDDEKYEEALELYKQVSRNDTNYAYACSEMVMTYQVMERYSEAIELSKKMLAQKSSYDYHFLITIGNSYDLLHETDSAYVYYNEGVRRFPYNHRFYHERSVMLSNQGNKRAAVEDMKTSIDLNPFYAPSHLKLGIQYLDQNYQAEASLSLAMFLLLEPRSKRSLRVLLTLEKMLQQRLPVDGDSIVPLPASKDLRLADEALKSGKGLKKSKVKSNLSEYSVVKQLYALMTKLPAQPSNPNDFWSRRYIPYFQEVLKRKAFEPFIHQLFASLEDDKVQKWRLAHTAEIEQFNKWSGAFLREAPQSAKIDVNGQMETVADRNEKNGVDEIGEKKPNSDQPMGQWKSIYSEGNLKAVANFNDAGKMEGTALYYHENGILSGEINFKNGEKSGRLMKYFLNGEKAVEENYVAGELDGLQKYYFATGAIRFEINYKNGKREGLKKEYYENGRINEIITYKDDKMQGEAFVYHDNGALKMRVNYVDDSLSGPYKAYSPGGVLEREGNFKSHNYEGEHKNYHYNGKLESLSFYKKGEMCDTAYSYYDNGVIEEKNFRKEGKLNGADYIYDRDGKLANSSEYRLDTLIAFAYYDKSGKILSEGKSATGDFDYVAYYPTGEKMREGRIEKGQRKGIWKEYSLNGILLREENYADDKLNGKRKEYYPNGVIDSELDWKDGEKHGYLISYFYNGKVAQEGWFQKNEKQGYWYEYFTNGRIKSVSYYLDDERFGYQQYFEADGRREMENYIEYDALNRQEQYDTNGVVYAVLKFPGGDGSFHLNHANGKNYYQVSMRNGYRDGPFTSQWANGELNKSVTYKNGQMVGKYRAYNEVGVLTEEGEYDTLGFRTGVWTRYRNDKSISQQITNVDREHIADYRYVHPNNATELTGRYVDEQRNGYFTYFDPSGAVRFRLLYERGRLLSYSYHDKSGKFVPEIPLPNESGEIRGFFANGKPSVEATYRFGLREGRYVLYQANGFMQEETSYKNFEQTGVHKVYDQAGKLLSEEVFVDDEQEGLSRYFYPSGKLRAEILFLQGLRHGPATYYKPDGVVEKKVLFVYDQPYQQ